MIERTDDDIYKILYGWNEQVWLSWLHK